LFGFATLALLVASATARAQPTIITLRGDACDLGTLEADITDVLAIKSVGDSRVAVVTHGSGSTLSAEVLFVDAEGQTHGPRVVSASACDDLFDSISLVIVMAIPDPVAAPLPEPRVAKPAVPSEAGGEPALPTQATARDLAVTRSARVETARTLALDGFVGGSSTVTGRGMNEQLLLGARLMRGRASVSLQARIDAPEEVRVSAIGTVTVTQADVSVGPCVHLSSFAGCGLASVGFVHGRGESLDAARSVTTPVLAVGLRIAWERFITNRLAVRVHLDSRAPLTRTSFEVDYMPVWESSRFEGSAGVGVLVRFL
jgi:hypothetical protein